MYNIPNFSQDVCPNGMVAYWKLDEEVVPTIFEDFYGDNFGFSENDKYPAPTEGLVGNSMFFDGNAEVIINPAPQFDFDSTSSFSIETWVKTEVTPDGPSIFISKYAGLGKLSWWLGYDNQGRPTFFLRDNNKKSIEFFAPNNIADNQWHHIVGVYNRTNGLAYLYVDAILKNQVFTQLTGNFIADTTVNIGHQTSSFHFYGWIDETAIYNTVLDETTINNHYLNGLSGRGYCDSVLVAVKDEILVKDFMLHQNYPNPFNPETTIKYELPEASEISLEIFSSLGEKIAELDSGVKEAGIHTLNFNAGNLSSGVYFYKLKAGHFVEVKKLLLMK